MVADFDIGAVERADGQRAVQRELHVAGAGGFHAGGRNLLGEVGGGNDHLGEADIVVGEEDDLQPPADRGIVVDDLGDVVDQLDDQLGVAIARRRLAGEDLDPRHPVALRLVLDRLVERDRLEDVEQLPLVFVDALDLHVEQRRRIDLDAEALADQPRQRDLVVVLDVAELLLERAVAGAAPRARASAWDRRARRRRRPRATAPVSLGLASISQRRKVMPLVLLVMRPG